MLIREWGGPVEGVNTYHVISRDEHAPIGSYSNTPHWDIILGYQLMRTLVLAQIPYPNIPRLIATNQFPLVRMDYHIIHRAPVRIIPLHARRTGVPNLDGPVLTRRHHPFSLTVETDAGDVVGMAFELEHWVWVRGLDVVELHRGVASRSEESLVGGDAEAVYLRVRVLNRA